MKKIKLLFVVVLMFVFVFNSGFSVMAEETSVNSNVKSNGAFKYVETDDGIEIVEYLLVSYIITIPSEIDGKPVTKITYLCDSRMWGDNSNPIMQITIPDSVVFINENVLEDCVCVYANPNSYARKFADAHNITFKCIEHTNIVIDAEIPPTCGNWGKTEGSHCADCNFILKEQNDTPRTSKHTWGTGVLNKQRTAKTYTCTVCGMKKNEGIKPLSVHSKVNVNYNSYLVTKSTKLKSKAGTVLYKGTSSKKSSITIPNSITVDGYTYKVTGIGENAFKNNKKIKKVTIGSNIISINKNAFYGCKNLTNITIKSKNIKSIGKSAFKGINSKAKIKVPSSKLKKYKTLFKNKGQKSTVKITK